jgi:2-oxoglutarate ferredoxin oxidoreductase subunit alpha
MSREIWKGSEAIAEAAIRVGCKAFFGYPITPQNEVPEYMSKRMPEVGGVFVQSESEVAAINMVYGAAASGARAMTSSSSPGISLKQEGISYAAAVELPCVIVNCSRGGPGLGTIQPSQADYFQATRGGGNGDYRTLVFAPADLQEAVDLMQEAFDIAEQYRNPVLFLVDGLIGQMMEPIEWKEIKHRDLPAQDWTASGRKGRDHANFLTSLVMDSPACEAQNFKIKAKLDEMAKNELRYEELMTEDAEIVIVAYGTTSRVAQSAIEELREKGIKAGMVRPITLWPFPYEPIRKLAESDHVKKFLTIEMSTGQMIEDVELAVQGKKPVEFYGKPGGMIPQVGNIEELVTDLMKD